MSPEPITDLHCHLLPGVDDGPATMEGALALAAGLVADGVRRVVATPHVSRSMPTAATTMHQRLHEVRDALLRAEIDLDVLPGAEIAADMLADVPESELRAMTLGGSTWVLLEAPIAAEFPIEAAVDALRARGFNALLAHPERCRLFQRAPERVARLVDAGCRTSITAGSLADKFGTTARRVALELTEAGLVHNAVSDAHDMDRRRPRLVSDLRRVGLAERVSTWCGVFPAALLAEQTTRVDAPAGDAERTPAEQAASLLAQGMPAAEIERELMRDVPATVARRIVARAVRSRA